MAGPLHPPADPHQHVTPHSDERSPFAHDGECRGPRPTWVFPRGWLRVSFDADQLHIGRAADSMVVRATPEDTPTPSSHVDGRPPVGSPAAELREQVIDNVWSRSTEDDLGDAPPRPILEIEAEDHDWVVGFDGCERFELWIEEWQPDGFVLSALRHPPFSTRAARTARVPNCRSASNTASWFEAGFVGVQRVDPDEIVFVRNGQELRLERAD